MAYRWRMTILMLTTNCCSPIVMNNDRVDLYRMLLALQFAVPVDAFEPNATLPRSEPIAQFAAHKVAGMCVMALGARLKSFLAVPRDNERLLLAQYHAFTRQVPLMYFVLLVNTWALVSTQAGRAPRWLAIYMPVLMTVVCAIRVYAWLRSYSHVPTPAEAHPR